jgi:hypothetical protein
MRSSAFRCDRSRPSRLLASLVGSAMAVFTAGSAAWGMRLLPPSAMIVCALGGAPRSHATGTTVSRTGLGAGATHEVSFNGMCNSRQTLLRSLGSFAAVRHVLAWVFKSCLPPFMVDVDDADKHQPAGDVHAGGTAPQGAAVQCGVCGVWCEASGFTRKQLRKGSARRCGPCISRAHQPGRLKTTRESDKSAPVGAVPAEERVRASGLDALLALAQVMSPFAAGWVG